MAEIAISAQGLTRHFGSLTAVDNVDLEIPKGSIYGFLGPNGSGKSTTIRMLCGLLEASAGRASVLGLDTATQAAALKQNIGYMTQRFSLYGDLSVRENLQFISEIYGLRRSARKARVKQLLTEFSLESQARQRSGTLSGGQKQRLALAAATLHGPSILFLDEPTSAVDPQNRRDFWETLFELASSGTTILVSTHYMDEAARCHKLAILDSGVKVADGTPKQLGQDIPFDVIEVDADDPDAARHALAPDPRIASITQLGLRLRALIPKSSGNPGHTVQHILKESHVQARIEQVFPDIEDVFVAVTEQHRKSMAGT